MEKYRRFKIYENNINNNPSNTNSSVQNKNQIKNTNLDGKSSVYRKYKYSNINHSKKIQNEYNEAKNKDDIQSQNKIIDKFTINNNKSNHNTINNNPKVNNFNKKFIYNFGNNLTNKENDKKLLMNSLQKNNIFKPKNDINKERQERQQLSTNLNRYSIKYNNNSNKLNKSIEKKNTIQLKQLEDFDKRIDLKKSLSELTVGPGVENIGATIPYTRYPMRLP